MAELGRKRAYPLLASRGVKAFQDESIYSLIKPEIFQKKKQRKYTSKYPGKLSPSYSTFGIHTTSNPSVNTYKYYIRLSWP